MDPPGPLPAGFPLGQAPRPSLQGPSDPYRRNQPRNPAGTQDGGWGAPGPVEGGTWDALPLGAKPAGNGPHRAKAG